MDIIAKIPVGVVVDDSFLNNELVKIIIKFFGSLCAISWISVRWK
jgi:hypothetical protein